MRNRILFQTKFKIVVYVLFEENGRLVVLEKKSNLILMTYRIFISCILLLFILNSCLSTPQESIQNAPIESEPFNIILMIGDGMGLTQISAALYSNDNHLVLENFPVIGFQKTHSATDLTTDSAAAATAMGSGIKTCNHCVGIDADSLDCKSILTEANENGLATGLVVTSSILHATPAAFYAHQPIRIWYERIALDLLDSDVDFFIGGGRRYFLEREGDDRNLYKELEKKGYSVSDFTYKNIEWINTKPEKKIAHFTAEDRPASIAQGRRYLEKATKLSLEYLPKRSDKGFFLMVEGSQIDWAGHAKKGKEVISEMLEFDKTIGIVLDFARRQGNTLVIVTADHETGGMSINEGSKINKLKTAFTTNGHTSTMVPVFAYGPMSEKFAGIYDNTDIYSKMKAAFGWKKEK